jgi:DNA-directed RNA polymerase subunit RPC12/RpoP
MVAYKPHYACFNCRKTFKRRLMYDIGRGEKSVQEAKCPECGELMANMGLDFESPKKDDVKKWEHIKSLFSVGIAFHSCGCSGPGYIPNSKEKLMEYFEQLKEKYLKNIDFWRSRIEPTNKQEKEKDYQKNWHELGKVSSKFKKEIIKNQEGITFWLERVKEIESKISLIR